LDERHGKETSSLKKFMRAPDGARGERPSDSERRGAGAVSLGRTGGNRAELGRGADDVAGGVKS
jgi:hypothetical protein